MYAILSFDTEDYITPESDDIAMATAEILWEEGLRGTFNVVGEKARALQHRGRQDVIRALAKHDVTVHTNLHSTHPTLSEYLEDKGWEDGVAEWLRREEPGVQSVSEIFGRFPVAWNGAGRGWGPQTAAGLRRLGIPWLQASKTHTRDGDVHWFAGTLAYPPKNALPDCGKYFDDDASDDDYEWFDDIIGNDEAFEKKLISFANQIEEAYREGLGFVNLLMFHPTKLRSLVWWDYLNYMDGVNPSGDSYQIPPAKPKEEIERALINFRRLVTFIRDRTPVRIVTLSELVGVYSETERLVSLADVVEMATEASDTGELITEDWRASPAELLYLLTTWAENPNTFASMGREHVCFIEGPTNPAPEQSQAINFDWPSLQRAAAHAREFIRLNQRVPTVVELTGSHVGPATLYLALAHALALNGSQGILPNKIQIRIESQTPSIGEELADGVYQDVPGWVHKPDLDVSLLALHTKLQSWTLRSARLKG